jgi:hypothetical protein
MFFSDASTPQVLAPSRERLCVGRVQDQEEARQGMTDLGQETPSAAYVEDIEASEDAGGIRVGAVVAGGLEEFVADKVHADGVHLVEELELAMLVPPVGGESREVGYLLRIDGRGS